MASFLYREKKIPYKIIRVFYGGLQIDFFEREDNKVQ